MHCRGVASESDDRKEGMKMENPVVTVLVEQVSLDEIKHPFVIMRYSDGSCRVSIDMGRCDIQCGGLSVSEALNSAMKQYAVALSKS